MNSKYSIVNMSSCIFFFALFLTLTSAQNIKLLKECADENLKALNNYRKSMGVRPLSMNSEARRRAEAHTKIMASGNDLDHSAKSFYIDAENIAQNAMRDDESPADMGDKFFQQWRRSSGHNRNMLRDNMKFIGIGCVARPGGYFETVYATQIFWREAHGGSTESPPAPVTVPPPPATQTEQDDEEELETPKQMPEEMPKEQPEMPEEQSEEMPEHKPKDMDDKNYNDYSFSSDDESVSSGNDAMMSPDGTDSNGNYMMEDKKERRRRRRHYRHRHSNIPKETETPQLMPDDSDSDEKRPFWFNWWGHDGNSDEGEKSDSHSSDDSDNGHRWYFSWFW